MTAAIQSVIEGIEQVIENLATVLPKVDKIYAYRRNPELAREWAKRVTTAVAPYMHSQIVLSGTKVLDAIDLDLLNSILPLTSAAGKLEKWAGKGTDWENNDRIDTVDGAIRMSSDRLEKHVTRLKVLVRSGNESLASQLEKLFPTANSAVLEQTVVYLDREISNLRKTTDKTYTGIVLDFEIDGKRVYCKVGSKAMLAKEAQYAKDAWQHQLMRPVTPKSIGLVDAGDLAGLLTYGTENIGIIAPEDFMAYFNMKNSLEKKFAKQESIDSKVLSKDLIITDMFNRAIAHTYMKEHMANPIYRTAMLDSVAPIEKLESRLCESTLPKDKIAEIVKLFPLYVRLAEEATEYDKEPTILAHFDPRAENIFPSRLGNRPTGDFGSAKPGTPEFDLGKMEVPNTDFYVQAYASFRNALEQAEGNNFELTGKDISELQDKVRKVGFVNALKMACFKSSRGLDPSNYINLSRQYAGLLQ